MANVQPLFAAVLTTLLVLSCNGGDFAGDSPKRVDGKNAGATDPASKGNQPNQTLGKTGNSNDANPNSGNNNNNNNNKPGLGSVGSNSDTSNGGTGTLADLLTGLLQTNNDVTTAQPNDNTIVFGGSKVFHIGDGQMGGSSCLASISTYSVAGTKYFFEFQVEQAGTDVSILINRVCGVDYSDTNKVSIVSNGVAIQTQPVPVNASSVQLQAQGLAVGTYQILVESRVGTSDPGMDPQDADDYIVGEVNLQGTKPIKPGKVGAN